MRDKIFYTICFGFLLGIFLRSFLSLDLYLVVSFGVIALALLLFCTAISKNKWGILFSVFILAFCFGIFRFHLADKPAPEVFENQVGQKVSFSGEIIDEPSIRQNDQQLTVEIVKVEERSWTTYKTLRKNKNCRFRQFGSRFSSTAMK